ncbi:protein kinase family protein [Kitasatospora sp. NPDC051853]|uniref:protein kinase family protein n=1 Tax=Kitasatospora sp. NPDC051853 TaxID=3364058 RepID=UPI003790367D
MADGTKAVVDTSATDDTAVATALGDLSDLRADGRTERESEATAPLSTAEIAAELADRPPLSDRTGATAGSTASSTGGTSKAAAGAKARANGSAKGAASTEAAEAARKAVRATSAPVSATGTDTGASDDAAPAATSEELAATIDQPTGELPLLRPAPVRHSGDRIADRYRLEDCITQSEHFSSWRAVDEKLRRPVGVHLLSAGHQRARGVLAAAKSAALLGDPRFVQVLDAVQDGDHVYVVREWLPGASDLAQLLAEGPMEPYEAYQMVRQVTDAIAAAHRRGQAHLRLTPRCVLRTDSGQYRINGIAVDAALRGLPDEDASRTDTRAIGALLFAALTHRWPYPEDRYDLQGVPKGLDCVPPEQVKAGVHKGLSELAARALCETPPHHQEPITTPEELAKAIALMPKVRQPEQPAPSFTPPPPPPRPHRPQPPQGRPQHHAPQHPSAHTAPHPALHEAPPQQPRPRRPRLRRLVRLTASVVALAVIGVASWQLVSYYNDRSEAEVHDQQPSTGATSTGNPAAPPGKPLAIAGMSSFNALGSDPEHVSEVPRAYDGDPATAWSTSGYYDDLGGSFRAGTGLLVDLGSEQQVSSVQVQFGGSSRMELYAQPKGTVSAPRADKSGLASFGSPVATQQGTQVELKPGQPLTTRYLLLWLTSIPKDGDSQYRGRIAEVKVIG